MIYSSLMCSREQPISLSSLIWSLSSFWRDLLCGWTAMERFLGERLWTKELIAPEYFYSLCSCSPAYSFFLSLETPCCGSFSLRDALVESGLCLLQWAQGGWRSTCWRYSDMIHGMWKVSVPDSFDFFFILFFFPLLSARTCCAAPLTSTSLLQAWSAWDRCYLGDGSGRTGYLTLRVFGANNTRIVSQIDWERKGSEWGALSGQGVCG